MPRNSTSGTAWTLNWLVKKCETIQAQNVSVDEHARAAQAVAEPRAQQPHANYFRILIGAKFFEFFFFIVRIKNFFPNFCSGTD